MKKKNTVKSVNHRPAPYVLKSYCNTAPNRLEKDHRFYEDIRINSNSVSEQKQQVPCFKYTRFNRHLSLVHSSDYKLSYDSLRERALKKRTIGGMEKIIIETYILGRIQVIVKEPRNESGGIVSIQFSFQSDVDE